MKIKLISKQDLAKNITTYRFNKPPNFKYIAGQYSEFHLKHTDSDERGIVRWFTLSSAPEEDFIEFTTKHQDTKSSSFKLALKGLKKGDQLDIFDAMGDYVLPLDIFKPLIFVAGGIGITPILSILKHLKIKGTKRPIYLYYITKKEEEVDIKHYLGCIKKLYVYHSSKDFNIKDILDLIDSIKPKEYYVYLSGPQTMVEENANIIKKCDAQSNIILDYFEGY